MLFLAWGVPWPSHGGGPLRTMALLRQLSRVYSIHLVILSPPPTTRQNKELKKYTQSIKTIPVKGKSFIDKISLLGRYVIWHGYPYHCALLHQSFSCCPEILKDIQDFPGLVYASYGHWGTLLKNSADNWILDQHNADVDFWRVYASQSRNLFRKYAGLVNWWLSARHFSEVYSKVGRIISVCEEDKRLTLKIMPNANVDIIGNGVDCSSFIPSKKISTPRLSPRLLFTGTSVSRNMTALHHFVDYIFPLVRVNIPSCELLVAGNFSKKAQREFKGVKGVRFTGRVKDMRPHFNDSDIFVSPFEETHGSKLKIAEAMAMAIPIVSTPEGIRGFELIDGESVCVARDDREFAEKIVMLARNINLRKDIGEKAREIALKTADWNILGDKLIGILGKHGI